MGARRLSPQVRGAGVVSLRETGLVLTFFVSGPPGYHRPSTIRREALDCC